MFRPPLRLTGFARGTHVEVIARMRDTVSSARGSILDSHLFSNAIVCINFEIPVGALGELRVGLAHSEIVLDQASLAALEGMAADSVDTCEASLSVNLLHDDPSIRIEVPAVPG